MRSLGSTATLAVFLLLGCGEPPVPADRAAATPVEERPRCPSFRELGLRVDRLVEAIEPGVTLEELTASGDVQQALDFWDDVEGGLRETVFFVGAAEGNAVVVDEVVCRFDRGGRLVSCLRECCRSESRSVTPEQYEAIRLGESRAAIESRLCAPSWVETESASRSRTYYKSPIPIAHHDEGQTVMLQFDEDRLSFKGMSPYY